MVGVIDPGNESDNYSWSSDDEREDEKKPLDSSLALAAVNEVTFGGTMEASSSSGPSSTLFRHFVGAGFSEALVSKALEENGAEDMDKILNSLLTYAALENSPPEEHYVCNPPEVRQNGNFVHRTDTEHYVCNPPEIRQNGNFVHRTDTEQKSDAESDLWSSDYDENVAAGCSDSDSCLGIEVKSEPQLEKDSTFLFLEDMGYPAQEISIAIERCGQNATVDELADFLYAAQTARAADPYYVDPPKPLLNGDSKRKKRKMLGYDLTGRKQKTTGEDEPIRLPKPMIGFGVPTESSSPFFRTLPAAAVAPPYFYYENVALAPKGCWDTIKRFLYDVEPEFVDSKYFCAAARKRGYIHNLPIENRFPLFPLPPRTIHEALPMTKRWWPAWDTRTKLNCLQTAYASSRLTERIRKALEECNGNPSPGVEKWIMEQSRKWNLVWVGRNKVAPLEPDEVEMLLGFPRNHTRGGGSSRTERYKSLGNSFQVDTVAYHLSVLKDLFPNGIKVLSLFTGIGGGEVALHRLGIRLNLVVSVEISEVNRNILKGWWEQTNQKGDLLEIDDVQKLTIDRLEYLMNKYGVFDFVIGGSPCNNLAGSNRVSRDGLEGEQSSLFFDYIRILETVKTFAQRAL